MKTFRISLIAAAFALTACGEGLIDGEDAGTDLYSLSSGTYRVSNAVLASQTDQCGFFASYQDPNKEIGISVNGTQVTFNLPNNPEAAPNTLDKANLNGNAIEQLIATNYTVAADDDSCTVRVHRTVTGTLVGNDTAELTLDFSVSFDVGTCTPDSIPFPTVPCESTYQFTATRK